MSCISQTYNCTVTWTIENFSVFLNQMGESFCVPKVEIESLNNSKWTFELRKVGRQLMFYFRKAVTNDTTQLETAVDFRVSFVGTDGSLHFPKIANGVKYPENTTQRKNFLFLLDPLIEIKQLLFPKDVVNIRVEMRFCDSNPLVLCSKVRTKMKIERTSFTCSAQKFCEFLLGKIPSFPIDVHMERSPNFNLMYQSGKFIILKRSGYQNRLVAGNPSDDCDVLLHMKIWFLNYQINKPWISNCLFFKSTQTDDKRTLPETNEDFSTPADDYDYWKWDVRFEFSFADGTYGTLLEQNDYSHPYHQNQMSVAGNVSHLGPSVFKDQKYRDITLIAGGKTYKAHKVVLSSASPVFSAMFEHEMKEQETGEVCIDDVEPDTLKRMLRFIYTDSIEGDASFGDIANLFAAADKYEICSLKSQCSSRLISMLGADNVCLVLHLAYMHDDKDMQQAAKTLFCKDPSKVLDSKEWKTFMEDCIRGRAAKSSTATFFNPHRLRRSISKIGERISKISLTR